MYKLVRDKIPEIAKANPSDGIKPVFASIIDKATFTTLLSKKLDEEVDEFKCANDEHALEEYIDILTVLNAIKKLRGWTDEDVKKAYESKAATHGEFDKHIIGIFEIEDEQE